LREKFRLLQGEELIKVYGKGEGAVKAFCVSCGSSLFGGDWPDGLKSQFAWARSMMIQIFGRNFTLTWSAAPRGTRSQTIFRNMLRGESEQ
jgi:hypothetical protein